MTIRITVMLRAGRRHYECQWLDPVTGRKRTKSTGSLDRREADRFAAKLAIELESGDSSAAAKLTWADVAAAFRAEVFPGLRLKTRQSFGTTFSAVSESLSPGPAAAVNEAAVVRLIAWLRRRGRSEFTVRGHCSRLRTILRWAHRTRKIQRLPHVDVPRQPVERMRGRPITGEEFERLLAATPKVVGGDKSPEWERLLRGLWLSGLRLGEAMRLSWDAAAEISVDLSGAHPLLRIQAAGEKGRQFRMLPLTPDFGEWLRSIRPAGTPRGHVFRPLGIETDARPSAEWAGKIVSRIGETAGVKVNAAKFASAHDLRRSFGSRWAPRVRAAVLMQLMRHSSIATTMQFYVGLEAQEISKELYRDTSPQNSAAAPANVLANTDHGGDSSHTQEIATHSGNSASN